MFNSRLTFIHQISKDFIEAIRPNGANMEGVTDIEQWAHVCVKGEDGSANRINSVFG